MSSTLTASTLLNGSLPLPHFGDWTQDGQPCSQPHEAIAARVAPSHSRATWNARSEKPAPPGWPS